jgi:chloride channel protein, CIC family
VPGRGIVASYSAGFWALVIAIGLIAGVAGGVLILLLQALEHLAWSYRHGTFLGAVERTTSAHRVLVLAAAGGIAAIGVLVLGMLRGFGGGEVSEALWLEEGRMAVKPSVGRSLVSIVVVAFGASLGREAAPQLTSAALASRLCEKAGIPRWQRRLLVACAAGAGLAAVYNVPLGGALFALEVLLGTLNLALVLPALLTTTIATAIAWIALGNVTIYHIPSYSVSGSQIVWAAIVGPLAGLVAVGWARLLARVHQLRPQGRARLVAPILVLTALGAIAIAYPQLLGNGQDTAALAITGRLAVSLLLVLVVLKPLVTAACLGSGTPGGLFTPTLTFGVLFGGLLGHAWIGLWPSGGSGSFAIIGGGAVLAASMQAPLAAIVIMIELAHHADTLIVPLMLAVTGAVVVARRAGAPSIYSARLGEKAGGSRPKDPDSDGEELADVGREERVVPR